MNRIRKDTMYKLIETILTQFRSCFKRESTFASFVLIVIGMLLRRDFRGVSSMGILQMIALHYPTTVWNRFTGWLRTRKSGVTSVETVRTSLQEEILWNFRKLSKFSTLQLILSRQRESLYLYEEDVS
jgi:hypothetical protein